MNDVKKDIFHGLLYLPAPFSLEGKIRVIFVACDLRKESSERMGDEMIVTVEELKRLEDTDIRDLRREDLDNAGDIVIDRQKSANQRMREFLEKTKNPYAENVGEYILQVTYSKTSEETLEALRKKHEALMEQLSEAENKIRELNRMKVHENFAVTRLTDGLLDEYVESIEVHLGNEVKISWK